MEDWSPLIISIKTAFVATVITFIIGVLTAWKVVKSNFKHKSLLDSLITLPMVLPPTVLGFFLLILLGKKGPIGFLLSKFDINIIFSWTATVIAAVVVSFPLMYKTCKGSFDLIDKNLINVAKTMGASEKKIFFKLVIPLAWPGILAGAALSFARALGEFGATLMIAGNIPGKTQTIPIAIYFFSEGGDMRSAMIWVSIVFMISLSTMIIINYWTLIERKHKIISFIGDKL